MKYILLGEDTVYCLLLIELRTFAEQVFNKVVHVIYPVDSVYTCIDAVSMSK